MTISAFIARINRARRQGQPEVEIGGVVFGPGMATVAARIEQ